MSYFEELKPRQISCLKFVCNCLFLSVGPAYESVCQSLNLKDIHCSSWCRSKRFSPTIRLVRLTFRCCQHLVYTVSEEGPLIPCPPGSPGHQQTFLRPDESTLLQIISIWSTMLQTKESMSGSIMQWVDRYPSTLEQMLTEIVWCSAVQFISWRGLRNLKRRTKGIISHWQARTHRIPISLSKIVLGEMYIHTIKPVNGSSGAILLMSVYVIKTIKMYVASVTLVLKVRRELSDVRQMIFKQIRINCYVELASRLVHGLGGTVFFYVKNVTLTPKHPSKGAIWSRSRGDVRETNGQFSVLF